MTNNAEDAKRYAVTIFDRKTKHSYEFEYDHFNMESGYKKQLADTMTLTFFDSFLPNENLSLIGLACKALEKAAGKWSKKDDRKSSG